MKHTLFLRTKTLQFILLILPAMFLWSCDKGDDNENAVESIESKVHALAIDKDNTLWIGTDAGLFKSIEEGFLPVTLPVNDTILSLHYEKSTQLLWIGTNAGLLKADISAKKIETEVLGANQLSNPRVQSFYFDDTDRRWIATKKGITLNKEELWKKEKFRVNTQGDFFNATFENFAVNSITSHQGDYYFATSGAKLYRAFDYNESVDAFSGATQWDFPYNGFAITDTMFVVFIDQEGKKWMGGKEGLQIHVGDDPKDMGAFTYYYDELPDPYVLAIQQAPNSDIWVGTRKGLAVFDGTNWETITTGLPDLLITAIAIDKDGIAWIGTAKGLVSFN
jgi:ligand-binding sensor domain-containing protein